MKRKYHQGRDIPRYPDTPGFGQRGRDLKITDLRYNLKDKAQRLINHGLTPIMKHDHHKEGWPEDHHHWEIVRIVGIIPNELNDYFKNARGRVIIEP